VRIISGTFRGKIIEAPNTLPVRPTTDFAKTALFNIFSNHFDLASCTVLDLYAGTGNITYEFISRGALQTVSVDINAQCVNFMRTTAEKLKATNMSVVKADCLKYLGESTSPYNIIFADPPYDATPFEKLVQLVFERKLLKPGGWLVLEHSSKQELPIKTNWKETRVYGAVAFSIFVL
jgi:16S rRNA (guanine966-N2)-methyltransferase